MGVQVLGMAPITNRAGGSRPSQVVVEIAVAESHEGRKRNPAARQIIFTQDCPCFENPIWNRIQRTRDLVFERAVRTSAVYLEEPVIGAGKRTGADDAPSGPPDLCPYIGLLIVIVRHLCAYLPSALGNEETGRCDRRNRNE